jgi:hypothetical protein
MNPRQLSAIEISRQTKLQPIEAIAAKLGIQEDDLEFFGKTKAKITLDLCRRLANGPPASSSWSPPSIPLRPAKAKLRPASA